MCVGLVLVLVVVMVIGIGGIGMPGGCMWRRSEGKAAEELGSDRIGVCWGEWTDRSKQA